MAKTIKRTVEMNLWELIKWAFENNIHSRTIGSNNNNGIHFNADGSIYLANQLHKADLFTVEIEEEITEEAKLSSIVIIDRYDYIANERNFSINDATRIYDGIKYIYLQNEDGSIGELIWKSGKLIV